MVLYRPDGQQMTEDDWEHPTSNALAVSLDGRQIEDAEGETSDDRFLLLLNAHHERVEFTIPAGDARGRRCLQPPVPTTRQ